MPARWNEDEFTESGFKSIKEFIGVLDSVEEDVEGEYGDQIQSVYTGVELVEAGDEVELEDDIFTTWVKQSDKKNSTNSRWVADLRAFADSHDIEWKGGASFIGMKLRMRRVEYDFGSKVNPGTAFVPIETLDSKKASKSTRRRTSASEPESEATGAADPLVVGIVLAIGESDGGLTHALLKKHVAGTSKLKSALGKEPVKFDAYMEALVEAGTVVIEDGVYSVPSAESEDDI